MAYGNKIKLNYDVPKHIKVKLAAAAKKLNMTATELLSKIIEEEHSRVTEKMNEKQS